MTALINKGTQLNRNTEVLLLETHTTDTCRAVNRDRATKRNCSQQRERHDRAGQRASEACGERFWSRSTKRQRR